MRQAREIAQSGGITKHTDKLSQALLLAMFAVASRYLDEDISELPRGSMWTAGLNFMTQCKHIICQCETCSLATALTDLSQMWESCLLASPLFKLSYSLHISMLEWALWHLLGTGRDLRFDLLLTLVSIDLLMSGGLPMVVHSSTNGALKLAVGLGTEFFKWKSRTKVPSPAL